MQENKKQKTKSIYNIREDQHTLLKLINKYYIDGYIKINRMYVHPMEIIYNICHGHNGSLVINCTEHTELYKYGINVIDVVIFNQHLPREYLFDTHNFNLIVSKPESSTDANEDLMGIILFPNKETIRSLKIELMDDSEFIKKYMKVEEHGLDKTKERLL